MYGPLAVTVKLCTYIETNKKPHVVCIRKEIDMKFNRIEPRSREFLICRILFVNKTLMEINNLLTSS